MRCPGQDTRYWKEDAIFEVECPHCGATVEFFKDDTKRRCPKCQRVLVNPKMDFGCALYCQYASLCLGDLPEEVIKERSNLLKERISAAVKRNISSDLWRRVESCAKALEGLAKKKGQSPGLNLLILYFYFLEPDKAKEVAKKVGLPEPLFDEIRLKIKEFKVGLTPEELLEGLIKA